ncbi:hypothetical protein IFM89_029125 [Coptis chinensis]|uniref:Auxin efflux carrier component n=1 Tax=Coptis chinensis TaxID=261450 RepID=A0A835IMW1_9MAGN|nr:hypothetical protein IFM89_029125 [Coptis chinensis]
MIKGKDVYEVLAAIVPLYVAMVLAYASVKLWKIFSPDQCSGINRFVAVFAIPFLSFHFISQNDPYAMNFRFLAADSLQKVVILFALLLWHVLFNGSIEWMISLFSLSTLPNTLVIGVPLLKAMYGNSSSDLMVQIVVLQSVIWYTLLLVMFEYRGARLLMAEQFPDTAGSITSFTVESDVLSLNGREPLEASAEIGEDGKLYVRVRRSTSSKSVLSSYNKLGGWNSVNSATPSNLTGVELYSIPSSREPMPRASSINQTDFYPMMPSPKHGYTNSFQSGTTDEMTSFEKKKGWRSMSAKVSNGELSSSYPPQNPIFSGSPSVGNRKEGGGTNPNKGIHMFVWSSNDSPAWEGRPVNRAGAADFGAVDSSRGMHDISEIDFPKRKGMRDGESQIEDRSKSRLDGSQHLSQKMVDMEAVGEDEKRLGGGNQIPPLSVMTRLIVIMVWRKLIRNPNTYSSVIALVWALVSYRFHIKMPSIVSGSINILSNTGLGMSMFALGLFMALQPKLMTCRKRVATFALAVRFLAGPAVIAATSIAAALPLGIVPFVFAKEYNAHAGILSSSVIFGLLLALPISITYYILLEL